MTILRVAIAVIAAGLVLMPAAPALAHPHDHPCAGPVDTNCLWGMTPCDYYVQVGLVTRCQQVQH